MFSHFVDVFIGFDEVYGKFSQRSRGRVSKLTRYSRLHRLQVGGGADG